MNHPSLTALAVLCLFSTALRAELKSWKPGLTDRDIVPDRWVLDTSTTTAEDAAKISTRLYGGYFSERGRPYHRPVLIKTSGRAPKILAFLVSEISGKGSAELYVSVDGKPYACKRWDPRGKFTETLLCLEVPSGNHEVRLLETSGLGEGVISISTYYLADSASELPATAPVETLKPDTTLKDPRLTGYDRVLADSVSTVFMKDAGQTFFTFKTAPEAGSAVSEIRVGALSYQGRTISHPTLVTSGPAQTLGRSAINCGADGRVWVFVGRGDDPSSPASIFRSNWPCWVDRFSLVSARETFAFPQPWWVPKRGWLLFFNPSAQDRTLFWKTSADGITWATGQPLTRFVCEASMSGQSNGKIGLFFTSTKGADKNRVTTLYYAQTGDFGATWTAMTGEPLALPLLDQPGPARVAELPLKASSPVLANLAFDAKGWPTVHYGDKDTAAPTLKASGLKPVTIQWNGKVWTTTALASAGAMQIPNAVDPFCRFSFTDNPRLPGASALAVGNSTGTESHALPERMTGEIAPLPNPADQAFASADDLLRKNNRPAAIAAYRDLLKRPDIPAEFHALILLRIAGVQFASDEKEAAGRTVAEVRALPLLPEHHRLAAGELADRIAGRETAASHRTPLPDWGKAALTLSVGAGEKFGTFTAALAEARRVRREGKLPPGPIELVATGASLPFEGTLALTGQDADKRNPLILRAANPDKAPLVSGGVALTHWLKEEDPAILARLPDEARGRVLRCDLKAAGVPFIGPLVFGGFASERARTDRPSFRFLTMPLPELFYNDLAQTMAQWPDTGYSTAGYTASADPARPALKDIQDDRPKRWTQEKDLWLHGYWRHAWADNYEKVKSIEGNTIFLEPPVNRYGLGRSQWRAVNALAELDSPGEWQLDTASQVIRYFPPANFDPARVVLSVRGPFLEADGGGFIRVDGLDLRHFRGNAIVLNNCSDTAITRTSISACSGLGIVIGGGERHLIHSVDIHNMGRGGIDIRSGDWLTFVPSQSIVENCHITGLSRIDRTYTPALLAEGFAFTIRHNLFENIPSSAIRFEASESLIELNEFARCVTESNDQGVIDLFGNPFYRGNVFRWNWFHDNRGSQPMVAAIRFDDDVCGQMVWENLVVRSTGFEHNHIPPFGGVQIHAGSDNHVEGNLFVDCDKALSNFAWGDAAHERIRKQPRYEKLYAEVPWQSPAWQQRYPQLATLTTAPSDRNYFAANISYDLRVPVSYNTASRLQSLNNALLDTEGEPSQTLQDLGRLLPPWHGIPLETIGLYRSP